MATSLWMVRDDCERGLTPDLATRGVARVADEAATSSDRCARPL